MQQMVSNFRTMFLFRGLAAILFGILTLVWPRMSLAVLVLMFGIFAVVPGITALAFLFLIAGWAIMTGILELVAPLAFPMSFGRGLLSALSGIISIVFGTLIAAQPAAGLLTVVWLIGIYAIIIGVMQVVVYFEARSVAHKLAGPAR